MCAACHLPSGAGQARDIRDGRRRNANPDMVKAIKPYTDKELEAIADFMSRLQVPEQAKKK